MVILRDISILLNLGDMPEIEPKSNKSFMTMHMSACVSCIWLSSLAYVKCFNDRCVYIELIRTTHHLEVGKQCLTQVVQATVYYNSNEAACKNEQTIMSVHEKVALTWSSHHKLALFYCCYIK